MTRTSSALSGAALFKCLHDYFSQIKDYRNQALVTIPLADFFMSAIAMFELKFSSLLKFDEEMRVESGKASKLLNLFNISIVPSDTHMRTVIDNHSTDIFRPVFKKIYYQAQRSKVLEDFMLWDSSYLLSVDGTGCYYSDHVSCVNCLEKKHKSSGEKSFYHQMMVGAIVHPDMKTVLPFCPEPIQKQDGNTKNDCESNAIKRFLINFREDHPKLKIILLTDALHSTIPCLGLLKKLEMNFIMGVKPGSHEKLFDGLDRQESTGQVFHFEDEDEIGDKVKKRRTRHYRFVNGVLLNQQSVSISVNFIEFWETIQWTDQWGENQETKVHMSWVTDYSLYESTARQIVKAGRTRWKIENETFNTLKNAGYEFEHNYGHGYKNLSSNLSCLMVLTFLVDQLQEMKCPLYRLAIEKVHNRKSRLWEKLKGVYEYAPVYFKDWTDLLDFFVDSKGWLSRPNSS